jgi:hypothetical protein
MQNNITNMIIPDFILKRLYVTGSLRQHADGIAFDIVNSLGPGILTGIHSIKVGPLEFLAEQIQLVMNDITLAAHEISTDNPAKFSLNQTGTCVLKGAQLPVGEAVTVVVDLISKEAGKVVISIKDQLKAA